MIFQNSESTNLTFHQTFRLELSNVAKVLACIQENPTIDNAKILKLQAKGTLWQKP